MRIGKRNTFIGKYLVIEARSLFDQGPLSASWRVYLSRAIDPISTHKTRSAAIAAAKLYELADRRRADLNPA
jgi:hypothetical protein